MSSQLRRAGHWLAHSGIQFPNGGVARYYRADIERNQRVSTEITGYALSAFVFLHESTGDVEYLDRARAGARFLTEIAWDRQNGIMPFELEPGAYAYFFDCGIIARGLLALWRVTRGREWLDAAAAIGESMARDFGREDGGYWPIVSLPDKTPLEMDSHRWSRTNGCYQLKAALAWQELAEATGEARFADWYERALSNAVATHESFLPGHAENSGVMDRLHAYLYFLEGLLPRAGDPQCAALMARGIERVSEYAEEIAPEFARCDVWAQLLRLRGCAGIAAEAGESDRLLQFQRPDGGFYFGRRAGEWIPQVSPVATGFAMQALEWQERREPVEWRGII